MTGRSETYGVILAGGAAQRMGGVDKGAVLLAGKRLFDHVYERLAPQVDRVLVSGAHDYDVGLDAMPDGADGLAGPAAGLFAVTNWLMANAPDARGFLTAPMDAPFLPLNLADRLIGTSGSAVVRCAGQIHPTFAYWELQPLAEYFRRRASRAPALHKIATALSAREVDFQTEAAFANVNAPEDLEHAKKILSKNG